MNKVISDRQLISGSERGKSNEQDLCLFTQLRVSMVWIIYCCRHFRWLLHYFPQRWLPQRFYRPNVSRQVINHTCFFRSFVFVCVTQENRNETIETKFIAFEMLDRQPSKYDKWRNGRTTNEPPLYIFFSPCQFNHNYYVINEMDYSIFVPITCYPSFNGNKCQLHTRGNRSKRETERERQPSKTARKTRIKEDL